MVFYLKSHFFYITKKIVTYFYVILLIDIWVINLLYNRWYCLVGYNDRKLVWKCRSCFHVIVLFCFGRCNILMLLPYKVHIGQLNYQWKPRITEFGLVLQAAVWHD